MSSASKLILGLPQQIADGIRAAETALRETHMPKISRKTAHIILCGMGGSALPGLLVDELLHKDPALRKLHLHTIVHRSYGLPKEAAMRPTLVVITSYSGNTEEALSSYLEARKRRLPMLVIASGGKLGIWAQHDKIPLARIPQGLPPRFAVGAQISALLVLLMAAKMLPQRVRNDLKDAASTVSMTRSQASARTMAKKLFGRIPLVYASQQNGALAYILKIQINENAKVPAFTHVFPELNHNEFNIFAKLSTKQSLFHRELAVIMLEDASDLREIRNRIRITRQMLQKANIPNYPIALTGRTPLLRMLETLRFGEWLAVELAALYKVDPLPTELIEEFKRKFKK